MEKPAEPVHQAISVAIDKQEALEELIRKFRKSQEKMRQNLAEFKAIARKKGLI